jgi:hypothetical protein
MKKEIVEIHLRSDKSTENCNLILIGQGVDLVAMLVAAMSEDQTFREMIEMSCRMYNIFTDQKPEILDHKN